MTVIAAIIANITNKYEKKRSILTELKLKITSLSHAVLATGI